LRKVARRRPPEADLRNSLMVSEIVEKPEPTPPATEQRPTILIVDDDPVLVESLSRGLNRQGFDTLSADSGKEGLARTRSEHPALIVLDLLLPDMDGFEICRELDEASDTCGIPVIILSGMERPDIIRRSRAVGCQYFVRKPCDPNALLVLIRQAINEVNGWSGVED